MGRRKDHFCHDTNTHGMAAGIKLQYLLFNFPHFYSVIALGELTSFTHLFNLHVYARGRLWYLWFRHELP